MATWFINKDINWQWNKEWLKIVLNQKQENITKNTQQ